jgi:hypothetical protein
VSYFALRSGVNVETSIFTTALEEVPLVLVVDLRTGVPPEGIGVDKNPVRLWGVGVFALLLEHAD